MASNIRRLRVARALSQEALAHASGLDRTYVSSIERCQYAVTVDVLDRLARSLGVQPHELLVPLRAGGSLPVSRA